RRPRRRGARLQLVTPPRAPRRRHPRRHGRHEPFGQEPVQACRARERRVGRGGRGKRDGEQQRDAEELADPRAIAGVARPAAGAAASRAALTIRPPARPPVPIMAATRYVKVDYAKPLPWYRRRAVRSVVLVLVLLGV